MEIHRIIADFNYFEEQSIDGNLIDIKSLTTYLKTLPSEFTLSKIGESFKKKAIQMIQWGNGKTKILLWGGMHGNEPTASAALCDLCNFLQHPDFKKESDFLSEKISLYIIPILNPDGVENFTRENAQNIDINRDFLNLESPEARILKKIALEIQPKFAFNLHNQDTLWSAGNFGFPASLSFLAPSPDKKNSISKNRKTAIKVISSILPYLQSVLPKQISRWDNTYEEQAFGDQLQAMGISTILIEAGGILNDHLAKIRAYYFAAILLSLQSIAQKLYKDSKTKLYKQLPQNDKKHVHLLIKNILLEEPVDIALNYNLSFIKTKKIMQRKYEIIEIAPKIHKKLFAYETIDAKFMHLDREISTKGLADFKLFQNNDIVLYFEKGLLKPEKIKKG